MCTVIFAPQKNGCILASIRDESPFRATDPPQIVASDDRSFLCPTDSKSGGTWFGINDLGAAIVLLNGAFINHLPNTRTYQTSRGTIVQELLGSNSAISLLKTMNLADVEPFTMVVKEQDQLLEFRWDGKEKFFRLCDTTEAQIWSSSTLYNREIQEKRRQLFQNRPESSADLNTSKLSEFFESYADDYNGFFMKRSENLRSVSLSFLEISDQSATFTYRDLLSGFVSTTTIP